MRIVRVQVGSDVHQVVIQDRTDASGQHLMSCDCGRSGWGMRGLAAAHTRPSPAARQITDPPSRPIRTWRDKEWWWNPMYDNRQDRREHLAYVWWRRAQELRRPRLVVRAGERALCAWYGHQESQTVPGVCYFCERPRPRRQWRARRWLPAPERDPQLRPGEGTQPVAVDGPVLRPVSCRPHRYQGYQGCPYCQVGVQ